MIRSLALAAALALPALAAAADFSFRDTPVHAVLQTAAVTGKFNVLVAPDLIEPLTFARKGVEPLEAVHEVAKLVGASVREVKEKELYLVVVTRKPLPASLATPDALPGQSLTDFSFQDVELRGIAMTMGVLGHFDAAVQPGLDRVKLSVRLKQVLPDQGLYWVAAVAGGTVEESTSGTGRKLMMVKPRPEK